MYALNEIYIMKKPHPCGGREWQLVRAGADVKIRCLTCGRTVTLTRDELKKRARLLDGEKRTEGGA